MNPQVTARYAQSYRTTAIQTASPGQLTLMLFDGALKYMDQARAAFEEANEMRRYEQIHNAVARAQAIISELQHTLNMEVEGDLPTTLFKLYEYIFAQLQKTNLEKDMQYLENARNCLEPIRDSWSEMLAGQEEAGFQTTRA